MQKLRIYEVNYTPMLAISEMDPSFRRCAHDNMVFVHHYDDPAQAMNDVADWAEGGDAQEWDNSAHEYVDIEEYKDYLIGEMVRHEDGNIEVIDTCDILEMYL
jgi:hypothetical protein